MAKGKPMTLDGKGEIREEHYASSPCMAHEVDPTYFDPLGVDPQQARDVARWRKAERTRLLEERRASGVGGLRATSEALVGHTHATLAARIRESQAGIVSVYWPIKSEPDLRPLMHSLIRLGLRVALPLVETKQAPLTFREWTPATRMARGDWNIPVPPPDAPICTPDLSLVPLVGWDGAGYRLGYGGGYFDRTLAALAPRPFTIGVGFQAARLATIFPQPHDIPMDAIVTETGLQEIART
jgi:5,10-methenyltetrahydrofolate synthetase